MESLGLFVKTPIEDAQLEAKLIEHRSTLPNAGVRTLLGLLRSEHILVSVKQCICRMLLNLTLTFFNCQRERVRAALSRMDPVAQASRWSMVIRRRSYFVPHAQYIWHVDGMCIVASRFACLFMNRQLEAGALRPSGPCRGRWM